jgi:hypothetical protein
LTDDSYGIEHTRGALQPRVGDENLLIRSAFYFEAPRTIPESGKLNEVITFAAGKRDRIAAVPVGACGTIDIAAQRCCRNLGILERLTVGAEHLAAYNIDLRVGSMRTERESGSDEDLVS